MNRHALIIMKGKEKPAVESNTSFPTMASCPSGSMRVPFPCNGAGCWPQRVLVGWIRQHEVLHGSAYYDDICLSLGIDEQYQASVVCVLLVHSRERDEVLYHLGHVLSCSTCFQGSVIYHHLTRCWCVCDMQQVQQYGITLFYLHSYIRLMMWYMYCMWWFHKDLASFVAPSMSFVPFGWSQVSTLQLQRTLDRYPCISFAFDVAYVICIMNHICFL